jgi:hypothetical protein
MLPIIKVIRATGVGVVVERVYTKLATSLRVAVFGNVTMERISQRAHRGQGPGRVWG